jgi:hypothetical protein
VAVRLARLGLRVDGDWFCSAACVADTASTRLTEVATGADEVIGAVPLRLGALLVHQGAVTPTQLAAALRSQKESGLPLGRELQRLGYVDSVGVLRGLAAQAGTSYLSAVDPRCVRLAPAGLCADEVRAMGIVPIRTVEADRLAIVACVAPVPKAALRAMQRVTGYTAVPYLVSEHDFDALAEAYGTDVPAGGDAPAVRALTVDSIHAAAQRIAATACDEGDVHLSQAYVEPLTWVRVAGPHRVEALFVSPRGRHTQDETWQAAITRH